MYSRTGSVPISNLEMLQRLSIGVTNNARKASRGLRFSVTNSNEL